MKRRSWISIVFLLACVSGTLAADVHDQLKGVRKEISEKKRLLRKTAKVEKQVTGELLVIDRSLKEKQSQLASLNNELHGVEGNLSRTTDEIERVKDETERKKQEIQKRLVSVYKAGEIGNLRVVFSSESFPQMVESLRYMSAVIGNDRRLFNEYSDKIAELSNLKHKLENEVRRKERIVAGIANKKREIEAEKDKKAAYLTKVKQDKNEYLASIRDLQANARSCSPWWKNLKHRVERAILSHAKRKDFRRVSPLCPIQDSVPSEGDFPCRFSVKSSEDSGGTSIPNSTPIRSAMVFLLLHRLVPISDRSMRAKSCLRIISKVMAIWSLLIMGADFSASTPTHHESQNELAHRFPAMT